jgi:outer membrane receptor protein involved in Fe transport
MPKISDNSNKKIWHLSFAALVLFTLTTTVNAQAPSSLKQDLNNASLEQLLELEVTTASKIAHQVSDSPSAVSIVTADDIKDYGYRTLAEILNSMRGLSITNDRSYEFLGGRGYSSPGEYSGRIMLLIDGVQVNDNVYNQSYFGNDGLIDTELIDRVEYVSGPGSVSYGNNAFYGIVNVFTKKGADFDGAQAALSAGSYQTHKGRLTYGKRLTNGVDLLVSASGLNSEGQTLYFPEFNDGNPAHNNGISHNQDDQRNQRVFAKIEGAFWSIETGYSLRHKDIPTSPYGSDFNSPYFTNDSSKFVSGQYHADLSSHLKLSVQTDYSDYIYKSSSLYSGEIFPDSAAGRRLGTEAKFSSDWFKNQQVVFGVSYRNDYQRKQVNAALASDQGRQSASVYAQDEITLNNNLWLNVGARYDYFTDDGDSISPRIALIYEPAPAYTFRLSHSTAHRTPTSFEKYYIDGLTQISNPDLKMEKVTASELSLERRWSSHSRLLASIYHQTTNDFITSTPYSTGLIQYFNTGSTHADGFELELEHHWENSMRLRTSYAYQDSRDTNGNWAINSPRHLGKFNLSTPLLSNALRAGLEVQSVSRRNSGINSQLSGYTISNLTVSTDHLLANLDISLTARNLFDKRYRHIAPDYTAPITSIEQDGRNFWLQLTYGFK